MISSPCEWVFSNGVEKSASKDLPYYHLTLCGILEYGMLEPKSQYGSMLLWY